MIGLTYYGDKMIKPHKVTNKDIQLLPDPVWVEEDNCLKPTPFFLGWWQAVAERRFGDNSRWLDAAVELGYVYPKVSPDPYGISLAPRRFEHDPALMRESLGLPTNTILVKAIPTTGPDWRMMWDRLLEVENE